MSYGLMCCCDKEELVTTQFLGLKAIGSTSATSVLLGVARKLLPENIEQGQQPLSSVVPK